MSVIELKKENIGKGYLVLINPDNLLKHQVNNLVQFDNEYKNIELEVTVNKWLHYILNKIKSKTQIVPVSGYRTLKEQIEIYESSLKENGEE
jgi:D-alanyl-D-alanine dipeptidase/carboxypeptidase